MAVRVIPPFNPKPLVATSAKGAEEFASSFQSKILTDETATKT